MNQRQEYIEFYNQEPERYKQVVNITKQDKLTRKLTKNLTKTSPKAATKSSFPARQSMGSEGSAMGDDSPSISIPE